MPTRLNIVTTVVLVRKEAAEQFAASKPAVKEVEDKVGGPLPMLCLIMALVDSDKMKRAYTCRNNISNARIVMDNQKSTKKRATTVWELLETKWNNPDFAPETEVVEDCMLTFQIQSIFLIAEWRHFILLLLTKFKRNSLR